MPFVRVKSARKTDPQHEFDVAVPELQKHPELYVVVDDKPVPESRPATFATPKPPRARRVVKKSEPVKKRAGKKPGEDSTAPAGADS
jgi:hypothetical protein